MPDHKQHCQDCDRQLGKPFPEVHAWLDAFYGPDRDVAHRALRHHLEGVEEVRKLWGDQAARAAVLHIMLDWDGIREAQIPRNQEEAEEFVGKWLSSLPRLDTGNASES
jgi:hypothetical protein